MATDLCQKTEGPLFNRIRKTPGLFTPQKRNFLKSIDIHRKLVYYLTIALVQQCGKGILKVQPLG